MYGAAIAVMALGVGGAAASPDVWVAALYVVVMGAGNGAAVVCNGLLVQRGSPDRLRGRTRHNKTVNFSGVAQPGEFARVAITSATSTTLAGDESLLARLS